MRASKIVILPGNGCSGNVRNCNWYGWLESVLLDRNVNGTSVRVELRDMPDPHTARESVWLPFVRDEIGVDERTVVIGHSSGAVAAMRLLESTKLLGVILVSACHTDLGDANERASGYYNRRWEWESIAKNARWIDQFHSTDDPFIPIDEARHVAESLGLVRGRDYHEFNGRSHFFSKPFPEIVECLDRRGAIGDQCQRGFSDLLDDIERSGGQRVAIIDGGFSTQLEKRGVKAHLDSALWTSKLLLNDPAKVTDVHDDFLAAGAHIIITSTYQASVKTIASMVI